LREALLLADLVAKLDVGASAEALLEAVLLAAVRAFATEEGSIAQLDPAAEELWFRAAHSAAKEELKALRLPITSGILGFVARSGQALCVNDVRQDSRFDPRVDQAVGFNTRNILAAPIVSEGKTVGVIELVNLAGDEEVTAEDLGILAHFADIAALILKQEHAQRSANHFVEQALRSRRRLPAGDPMELARALGQYRQDPSFEQSLELAALVHAIVQRGEEETRLARRILEECFGYLTGRDRDAAR
jgi:GAF domain-containing protein